jgi:hypothetical protein
MSIIGILPAMRTLHRVDYLREITFATYHHMTKEQMVGMLEHLSPPLNMQEKAVLLFDLQDSDLYHQKKEPEYEAKFPFVWHEIRKNLAVLSASERALFETQFI